MRFIIQHHDSVFAQCASVLATQEIPDDCPEYVLDILHDFGYLPLDGISSSGEDLLRNHNRVSLLGLASKFDKIFELPLPYAPGAKFFGGMISTKSIDVKCHGDSAVSVGGRGNDLRRAFESCLGEAVEYLSFIERDDEQLICELPSNQKLNQRDMNWVQSGLGLKTTSDLDPDQWICANELFTSKPLYFPADLILRRPTSRRIGNRPSESSGLSAASNLDAACTGGLLEVIERDAIALWWFGGRPAHKVEPNLLENTDHADFVKTLRGKNGRNFWLLDITSDIGVPVVAALSSDSEGSSVVAGFSAGLTLHHAIRRALLEMCQMELAQEISLSKLNRMKAEQLLKDDHAWIRKHSELSVHNFPRLHGDAQSHTQDISPKIWSTYAIVDRLKNLGYNTYCVNLTRPDICVPVAKIVVPGLQSSKSDWVSERLEKAASTNNIDLSSSLSMVSPI